LDSALGLARIEKNKSPLSQQDKKEFNHLLDEAKIMSFLEDKAVHNVDVK
jgi:hypothetical protein